ncbi:MAG: GatB/YqeY domain-containing protein [Ignavibacteria bacterium]|jgi:uncharacterized protein YqeY|nr:GatB/YqeY domain-containing protein [Ignavibacteria bacterium]
MSLEETINVALKDAMKSGDKIRTETLRSIRAGIIEFAKSGAGHAMLEADELKVLNSNAKKRKDAIEMYEKGGRADLADKEKSELAIIQEFLPKQMDEAEITAIVQRIISESGATNAKDFGKVIGLCMKELKGRADGNVVQGIVKGILNQE